MEETSLQHGSTEQGRISNIPLGVFLSSFWTSFASLSPSLIQMGLKVIEELKIGSQKSVFSLWAGSSWPYLPIWAWEEAMRTQRADGFSCSFLPSIVTNLWAGEGTDTHGVLIKLVLETASWRLVLTEMGKTWNFLSCQAYTQLSCPLQAFLSRGKCKDSSLFTKRRDDLICNKPNFIPQRTENDFH